MTVKDIIISYLNENSFDGLCAAECGCGVSDIMPCHSDPRQCKPAYAHVTDDCLQCPGFEDCSIDKTDGESVFFCDCTPVSRK